MANSGKQLTGMKPGAHQKLQRMAAISLVGLVVGLISAFATIGFVELVNYLNDLLYVSAPSRAELDSDKLWLTTIGVLSIGGLIDVGSRHRNSQRPEGVEPCPEREFIRVKANAGATRPISRRSAFKPDKSATVPATKLICATALPSALPTITSSNRVPPSISAAPRTWQYFATILTGLYPPRHGVRFIYDFALDPNTLTLATELSRAG